MIEFDQISIVRLFLPWIKVDSIKGVVNVAVFTFYVNFNVVFFVYGMYVNVYVNGMYVRDDRMFRFG